MNVPDPRVGTVLQGRYQVLERVTSGSMGTVYRGERITLKRPVAIKFLHEGYAATDDGRRRFEVEAKAMSRLEHPNCVPVTDFGVDDGCPYLVMDFVKGYTLRQLLKTEWRLAPARAVAILRQLLAGLAHAHAQGIIHRDLKPENVLVTPLEDQHGEHVRIVDFGLAKLRDEGSITTGVAVGTPSYMSPEQTIGERADERADVYACGIILYELLSGAKPFQADNTFEVMRMHREDPPPPLDATAQGVTLSPRLVAVVMKALAKSRDDRFASAAQFRAALEAVDEAGARRRSGGARPLVALFALAALGGGGFFAWQRWGRNAATPPPPLTADAAVAERPAAPPPPNERAAKKPRKRPPPDAAPVAAAPPDAAPAPAGPAPDPTDVARLRGLAGETGDVAGAIAGLEELRTARPTDVAVHYALANLYAQSQAWAASTQAYAATLRLETLYRRDPRLIADVVEALGSKDGHELAARLIERELGAAALPRLEEATRSTNPDLRTRAAALHETLRAQ